jgi:hypothetical protein
MNDTLRTILFRIFFLIFVIITIFLSLYATGYNLSFSWPLRLDRLLQKTGTLALDSNPQGATITINGKIKDSWAWLKFSQTTDATPTKIKHLLPGEYDITFSLANYWPYEKKVWINPEQTTFLENINLFRKSSALNITVAAPQTIDYSPNGQYAYLPLNNQIIDLKTEETVAAGTGEIQWLDNGNSFLNNGKITDLVNKTTIDYSQIVKTPATNWQWCSQNSLLLYCANNNLNVYNQQTKTFTSLAIDGQPEAYQNFNQDLFLVSRSGNKTFLSVYSFSSQTFSQKIELLPSNNFSFKNGINNGLTLFDGEHNILYLLDDGDSNPISDIIRNVTAWTWLSDNKIAYTQGLEIYLYNLTQKDPFLITRLSQPTNSLAWNPKRNYLLYSTANNIGSIDFATAGNNMTTIWQGDNISSLHLDTNNEILYFSGTSGQQSGFYKIQIR